jgi:predicted DNA binding protein
VLDDHGAHVQRIQVDDGVVRYHLEIASEADVRSLADHVEGTFADTRIVSKRERTDPVDPPDALPADDLDDLTDRQQEALEAAYRAGYFNWPRDSTAEEVAETLGITSATLHSHLRKAQSSLLTDVFDSRPGEAGSD